MMKPYIITSYGAVNNALVGALYKYIVQVVSNPPDHVDSPEAMEDVVSEWLAEHGNSFRRCRADAVATMIRPYRGGYYVPGHLGIPCFRVFYEAMNGTDLYTVAYVGFCESD